jgi:hypothetical protein
MISLELREPIKRGKNRYPLHVVIAVILIDLQITKFQVFPSTSQICLHPRLM